MKLYVNESVGRWVKGIAAVVVLLATSIVSLADSASVSIDFARSIRPLLSEHCYECHGPDDSARATDLRLDDPAGLFRIVEPGQPDHSELLRRVTAKSAAERMPLDRDPLSEREIALLQQWIAQGAQWQPHWAFVKPQQPLLPPVQDANWPRNEIDYFTLARLESAGLSPAAQAGKETLIRRVTLDLTGLPPSLEEIDAFLADQSPRAYERLVARLLSSPRYGERMAAVWLDAARYADTYGYQDDGPRSMWRWRDWVIEAFNHNMPFDRFTIEQLAGDLLPQPTLEQRIATGFNRNHRANAEGGAIAEEFRVEYVVDRVDTTCTVWLGLTMVCARCHDHKYDPITQREFYELYAFFNNIEEDGRARKNGNTRPLIHAPRPAQLQKQRQIERALAAARTDLAELESEIRAAQRAWEHAARDAAALGEEYFDVSRSLDGHYRFDGQPVNALNADEKLAVRGGEPVYCDGIVKQSLRLDGKLSVDAGDVGNFSDDDPFTIAAWIRPQRPAGTIVSRFDVEEDPHSEGYALLLKDGRLRIQIVSQWLDDAIRLETRDRIELNRWTHVAASYDGLAFADGVKLYIDGAEYPVEVEIDSLYSGLANDGPLRIGTGGGPASRFRGDIDDVRIYEEALAPQEVRRLSVPDSIGDILLIPEAERDVRQSDKLRQYFLENRAPPSVAEIIERIERTQRELQRLIAGFPTVMIMQERQEPRPTFVLTRGRYDSPGEAVHPDVPDVLPPLPGGMPRNRLGLARWLVHSDNPLSARVLVNRLWQMSFGTGLVKTSEDFGVQGELPSHLDLLDWLAVECMRRGWDVKEMRRLIVTSATYRQSSRVTSELWNRDPHNRLMARGPRFRLPAEMLRDAALSSSGLLVEKLGGPSVRPYQPSGLWEELSDDSYERDQGENLYRRSLYTFWKRTVPHPAMALFDAAGRETCQVRKQRTNTPLQALVLMNEDAFVEAARKLAERVATDPRVDEADRLPQMFRTVTARRPTAAEYKLLTSSFQRHRLRFDEQPSAAASLLDVGESPVAPHVDKVQLAAYTSVASMLLNLDEALTQH